MKLVDGSIRMIAGPNADPGRGRVRWKPVKSVWIGSMTLVALILGPLTASWDAMAVFLVTSAVTLCAGHSVGMHRRLIHNSFECPLWLEYVMVELGTLVGMAGPIGMMKEHDVGEWGARQEVGHVLLVQRRRIWCGGGGWSAL